MQEKGEAVNPQQCINVIHTVIINTFPGNGNTMLLPVLIIMVYCRIKKDSASYVYLDKSTSDLLKNELLCGIDKQGNKT